MTTRIVRKAGVKIILVIVLLMLLTGTASAEETTLESLKTFVTALRILGSSLFILALIWGGSKILFSGGDPRMLSEGKNVIKNAIIGYTIIVCASLIPDLFASLKLEPLVLIPP